jgi:putative ABC transport system substrate-binding protein
MRRRDFITLLSGTAAAWPLAARGQELVMPLVGLLSIASSGADTSSTAGFRQGLREAGFVEGRNVAIEYRWGEGRIDRLPRSWR